MIEVLCLGCGRIARFIGPRGGKASARGQGWRLRDPVACDRCLVHELGPEIALDGVYAGIVERRVYTLGRRLIGRMRSPDPGLYWCVYRAYRERDHGTVPGTDHTTHRTIEDAVAALLVDDARYMRGVRPLDGLGQVQYNARDDLRHFGLRKYDVTVVPIVGDALHVGTVERRAARDWRAYREIIRSGLTHHIPTRRIPGRFETRAAAARALLDSEAAP